MIVFDFDQTLVDTAPVEHLRARKDWKGVMARAGQLEVYSGITELLGDLHARGHVLAIVTKSPDMVPKAFIRQHRWPIDIVVGYHHVKFRKPNPEGLLLAMSKAGATPDRTYHVGDQVQDTEASRGAKVVAVGVTWGLDSDAELRASRPDVVFDTVAELAAFFLEKAP